MSLMDYERPSLTTDIVLMRIDERQSKNNRKNNEKIRFCPLSSFGGNRVQHILPLRGKKRKK